MADVLAGLQKIEQKQEPLHLQPCHDHAEQGPAAKHPAAPEGCPHIPGGMIENSEKKPHGKDACHHCRQTHDCDYRLCGQAITGQKHEQQGEQQRRIQHIGAQHLPRPGDHEKGTAQKFTREHEKKRRCQHHLVSEHERGFSRLPQGYPGRDKDEQWQPDQILAFCQSAHKTALFNRLHGRGQHGQRRGDQSVLHADGQQDDTEKQDVQAILLCRSIAQQQQACEKTRRADDDLI